MRLVCENDGFVALVPFWAVWPFETLVISTRHAGSLADLSNKERDSLADLLKKLTTRYDHSVQRALPLFHGIPPTARRTKRRIRNGICMRIFIRRCCVQPR